MREGAVWQARVGCCALQTAGTETCALCFTECSSGDLALTTRRSVLKGVVVGAGAVAAAQWGFAFTQSEAAARSSSLLEPLLTACSRLAPLGWRQLLLDVTNGDLDISAPDLAADLIKPLAKIDRTYPGFGDFSAAGTMAVEAGRPSLSLLLLRARLSNGRCATRRHSPCWFSDACRDRRPGKLCLWRIATVDGSAAQTRG